MPVQQKKVYVKTYGCQMNAYDSERMREALVPLDYRETQSAEDADLVILNTCHIRDKAAEKVYSELGKLRHIKSARQQRGEALVIAVAGCVAQAEGQEIVRRAPVVDVVIGPQSYQNLPALLARAEGGAAAIETEFQAEDKFARLAPRARAGGAVTAFLTVQEGCDKFCTFCVVPYTRGAEFSRPAAQIAAEARKLAERGVREITLLGQNVNAYRGQDATGGTLSLAGLVAELSLIPGIERIRYTTSHPQDMGDDLIEAHGKISKLMPYLHLPVQSGSNRILKAMNRGHDREAYLRLLERIRAARPDIALSGDFIVGFPGETDADFQETLALARAARYASAFTFKYSPRPGTPAAGAYDQVPEALKSERLQELQALIRDLQQSFNTDMVGLTLPVLIEKEGRHPGQMVGRSPYLQPVNLQGDRTMVGSIIDTRITGVGSNSLSGHYARAA